MANNRPIETNDTKVFKGEKIMAKKIKKEMEKTYERRIEAVITCVDGSGPMTNEEIAALLKKLLKCDDVQVKSVKTFEHEK